MYINLLPLSYPFKSLCIAISFIASKLTTYILHLFFSRGRERRARTTTFFFPPPPLHSSVCVCFFSHTHTQTAFFSHTDSRKKYKRKKATNLFFSDKRFFRADIYHQKCRG